MLAQCAAASRGRKVRWYCAVGGERAKLLGRHAIIGRGPSPSFGVSLLMKHWTSFLRAASAREWTRWYNSPVPSFLSYSPLSFNSHRLSMFLRLPEPCSSMDAHPWSSGGSVQFYHGSLVVVLPCYTACTTKLGRWRILSLEKKSCRHRSDQTVKVFGSDQRVVRRHMTEWRCGRYEKTAYMPLL